MRRSPLAICMRLIVLVKPLYIYMISAIALGLAGHLAASFITISGTSVLLNLSPFSVSATLMFMGVCALVMKKNNEDGLKKLELPESTLAVLNHLIQASGPARQVLPSMIPSRV